MSFGGGADIVSGCLRIGEGSVRRLTDTLKADLKVGAWIPAPRFHGDKLRGNDQGGRDAETVGEHSSPLQWRVVRRGVGAVHEPPNEGAG